MGIRRLAIAWQENRQMSAWTMDMRSAEMPLWMCELIWHAYGIKKQRDAIAGLPRARPGQHFGRCG